MSYLMRGTRSFVALGGIAALVAVTAVAAPAVATHRRLTSTTENIAPGLTLTRVEDSSGPYSIRILTIDPTKAVTIDTTLAGSGLPGRARTSEMGQSAGALAAINGDFNVDPGTPLHNFAEDGQLVMTGFQNGASFSISKDEANTYIENARPDVDAQIVSDGHRFNVVQWNHGDPDANEVNGYTKLGGSAFQPPDGGCFTRLLKAGKMHWAQNQEGIYREYKVATSKCQSKRMGFRKGVAILASKQTGSGSTELKGLTRGVRIRLTWDMVGASRWAGDMDVVGGMPLLVDEGENVAKQTCGSYFCERNPRTGIGYRADGTIVMVTVDGRNPGVSMGMTLYGFANYMKELGCVDALNLDGGGSTTMWVKGQGVVNEPTDSSGERSVTNAVLVLPGADTEATPLAARYLVPNSSEVSQQAAVLEAVDSGSTGGLLDAIARGEFGRGLRLPPALAALAASFAASR